MNSQDDVKELIKGNMTTFNKAYGISQDQMIELIEDILLELKTQEFMLPTLKKAVEGDSK